MRLLVTRPEAQARDAVETLRARGIDAQALPLIGIAALAEGSEAAAALRRAAATLAERRLAMFVSANAVQHFAAALATATAAATTTASAAAPSAPWPAGTLAGSTGPGTSAALLAAGVPRHNLREPAAGAERLDSEALWQQLRPLDWRGARALIVRGEGGGRDWLGDTLRGAGAEVEFVAAYRRTLPEPSPEQAARLAAAEADPAGHAWLFASSEAVRNLPRLAPARRWRDSPALATHPRIAEAARAAGFTRVLTLAPGIDALLAAWQMLAADAAAVAGESVGECSAISPTASPGEGSSGDAGEGRSIESRPL